MGETGLYWRFLVEVEEALACLACTPGLVNVRRTAWGEPLIKTHLATLIVDGDD